MFTPEFLERARTFGIDSEGAGLRRSALVPRSGTTLVEQILASHPQVHGAGERKEIDQLATTLHKNLQTAEAYPACMRDDSTRARPAAWPTVICSAWQARPGPPAASSIRCRKTTSTSA